MARKVAKNQPNRLLSAARKARGWTQQYVADSIGAPLVLNITRWERGQVQPSSYYVQRLSHLFGMTPLELGLLAKEEMTNQTSPLLSYWNIPYRRNPFFTGRGYLFDLLQRELLTNRAIAISQPYALSGLGGIGKTQIAIEYAYRYRKEYNALFWVRAGSRETLIVDYVALARLIGLPGYDAPDQVQVVEAVKRWLMMQQDWLLIMDNADDLKLVAGFLPTDGAGHLLLTTRAQATGNVARSLVVEQMEMEEACLFLLRRSKHLSPTASLSVASQEEYEVAQAIVQELDALPLALDQAGAYIEEMGSSLSEYLMLYRQHRTYLLARRSSIISDYPYTVASTWAISFQQIEKTHSAAAQLLHLCAFLDSDAIAEEILVEGGKALDLELRSVVTDPLIFNNALQVLRRYSLVRRNPEGKSLSLHRLVQQVLQDKMERSEKRRWAESIIRLINAAFPEKESRNWRRYQQCIPHVSACAQLIEQEQLLLPESGDLLTKAGSYLRKRGQFALAHIFLSQALTLREQLLGPDHTDTAITASTLGDVAREQGNFDQAEALLERALAIWEQQGGPGQVAKATTLTDRGYLYLDQGNYQQAAAFCQRAIAIFERLPDQEYPEQITSMYVLAHIYYRQQQYTKAEKLNRRALALSERIMPDGLMFPSILNQQGILYFKQGHYAEAEAVQQRSLNIFEQLLGPDNIDTVTTVSCMAMNYFYQGKYEQADTCYLRTLAVYEQQFGSDHHQVSSVLNNLALSYFYQGRYIDARALLLRAKEIQLCTYGLEHSETAITLSNLGRVYIHQGKYEQGEDYQEQALKIFEQTIGLENQSIASALRILGYSALLQKQYERSAAYYQQSLEVSERAQGQKDAQIGLTLCHQALLLTAQGRGNEAKLLYQRGMALREQALGPLHPETVAVKEGYLRYTRRKNGDETAS